MTTEHDIIHVEVDPKTWTDQYEWTEVITRAGLSNQTAASGVQNTGIFN